MSLLISVCLLFVPEVRRPVTLINQRSGQRRHESLSLLAGRSVCLMICRVVSGCRSPFSNYGVHIGTHTHTHAIIGLRLSVFEVDIFRIPHIGCEEPWFWFS